MRKLFLLSLTALAVLFSKTASAQADDFSFTDTGGDTLTFSLPSSPTPDASLNGAFVIDNVNYTLNGVSSVGGFGFDTGGGWVLGGANLSLTDFGGGNYSAKFNVDNSSGSLFSGPSAVPTFLTGTFTGDAEGLPLDAPFPGSPYTLTITPSTVPEPSSLLLLGSGIASFGAMVRRRAAKS